MRADIGRLLILHSYGGLYSDLDVMPNRSWYPQYAFSLPRVQLYPNKKQCQKARETGKWRFVLEM